MACVNDKCEIIGGAFIMGSDMGDTDERPTKVVTVSGFLLGKHEVTIGDYRKFLGQTEGGQLTAVLSGCGKGQTHRTVAGNPGESADALRKRAAHVFVDYQCSSLTTEVVTGNELPPYTENQRSDDFPVVGLTYNEKRAYCQAQGGDLPTEAQLERAMKGVDGVAPYGTPIDKAIIYDNGYRTTQPVCGPNDERTNSFGVCDLAGNVWESALDAYDQDFYSRMPSVDPYNPHRYQ
ncbi:MAG: hypothetical protein COV46_06740 [Deltaproteobacteria bacterium CG11_big_fil_rev_8_21_14_0_20_49_13]|nr:MAG: hypothetical protein COV46_06740 [Deltaproteobacteria bacterium CG11_big_fil_rev_8_21_14_0_20_49_13]